MPPSFHFVTFRRHVFVTVDVSGYAGGVWGTEPDSENSSYSKARKKIGDGKRYIVRFVDSGFPHRHSR